jgi:phage tail-like protein
MSEQFVTASNFRVSIEGLSWDNFDGVEGLGIDFEDIQVQSQNKNAFENRPGRSNAKDIVLTRRFKKDGELYNWVKEIKAGKKSRKSGSVSILDDENKEVVRFDFTDAWPKSWQAPALSKAVGGNDTPYETIVLSVSDIEIA